MKGLSVGNYEKWTQRWLIVAMLSLVFIGCANDAGTPSEPKTPTEEHIALSGGYLNHRFFRLDSPASPNYPIHDWPGRDSSHERIDPNSVKIFKRLDQGPLGPDEVSNIAVYVDTTGVFWGIPGITPQDFSLPCLYGQRWQEVEFNLVLDVDNHLVAIDLMSEFDPMGVLGAIYNVVDESGYLIYRIGDRPGSDENERITLPGEDGLYYRMKLIKAPITHMEPHTFNYVLRNYYSLGGTNIDINTFEFRIERNVSNINYPAVDEAGIPYIQIFGLDQYGSDYSPIPDGVADSGNQIVFDLRRGLLKFPQSFPTPFAAGEEAYRAYIGDDSFEWEGTFLEYHQAPAIYSIDTLPSSFPHYGFFRLVTEFSPLEE